MLVWKCWILFLNFYERGMDEGLVPETMKQILTIISTDCDG